MNSLEGRRLKRQLEDAKERIRTGATICDMLDAVNDITYDDMIEAGRLRIRGEYWCQHGSKEAINHFSEGICEEYWKHWSILTGQVPEWSEEDRRWYDGNPTPFTCSC